MKRPDPILFEEAKVSCTVLRGPKDGRWYWQTRGAYDATLGKRPNLWAGWATRAEAELVVAALVAEKQHVAVRRRRVVQDCKTLGDLIDYWAAYTLDRQDLSDHTPKSYISTIRAVKRTVGDALLQRVTMATLARHRDARLRNGIASATVEREIVLTMQALKWGREVGLHDVEQPAKPNLKVRPSQPKVTPRPADAWRIILNGTRVVGTNRKGVMKRVPAFEGRWRDFAIIAAGTGARPVSVGRLRSQDIKTDPETGRVTIYFVGKIQPYYPFPVRGLAADVARELAAADTDRLWPRATAKSMSEGFANRLTEVDWEAAGIERFTPYGLRRMVEDEVYEQFADPSVAAKLLDHTPEVALRHYRRPRMSSLEAAVEAAGLGGPTVTSIEAARRRKGDE